MKISKILAGFSAAALAASMMSMVSFAEDADDVRVAPAMGSIWNGEEGVEITDYEFAEWGGGWVQVDLVAPEGFETDTSDAMFVVEMVSTKDVSKDDQLFSIQHTNLSHHSVHPPYAATLALASSRMAWTLSRYALRSALISGKVARNHSLILKKGCGSQYAPSSSIVRLLMKAKCSFCSSVPWAAT